MGHIGPISSGNVVILGLPEPREGYTGGLRLDAEYGPVHLKVTPISKDLFLTENSVGLGYATKDLHLTLDYARLGYFEDFQNTGDAGILSLEAQTGTFFKDIFQISGLLRAGIVRWQENQEDYPLPYYRAAGGVDLLYDKMNTFERTSGLGAFFEGGIAVQANLPSIADDSMNPYLKVSLDGKYVTDVHKSKSTPQYDAPPEFSNRKFSDSTNSNLQTQIGLSAGAMF